MKEPLLIILLVSFIVFSMNSYSQFELKPGISGSQFESQIGAHMDAAYVSRDFFSIGLFGSYGKVFSALDKNHIMATGLVMEFRGCFSENMKVFPLLNVHIGRSWEYKKHYYTYGDNDEYVSDTDHHLNGFSLAARIGMVSNFNKTGRFQF